ncbi:MAG: lytic transglycosylase domain-containing protein [Pseudomonadota bacterium]
MTVVLLSVTVTYASPVVSEIYIYRGKNGEKVLSDRPMPTDTDYDLLTRRDTLENTGHILANRRVAEPSMADVEAHITSAAERHQVDETLIAAIIEVESSYDPNAVSSQGAGGLMQLMPGTARDYQVVDRFNVQQNIDAGTRHLKMLMERFNGDVRLVIAAYNAGAGAVTEHGGVPPYAETERFVTKVIAAWQNRRKDERWTFEGDESTATDAASPPDR